MKKWTLRFRAIDKLGFEDVKNGLKTIETRAATVRYREIKKGDTLVFICAGEKFEKQVMGVKHFQNISDMPAELLLKSIMPRAGSREEVEKEYASYPNYVEKMKKFGILAFELEKT